MRLAAKLLLTKVLLLPPILSFASLIDRGGGLIYDNVLDVTWLQDANFAQTSGFDADGRMLWPLARNWAGNLEYYDPIRNVVWTNWRLPSVAPQNELLGFNYQFSVFGDTDVGQNITSANAELSYMHYMNLGNSGRFSSTGVGPLCGQCLVEPGPFLNLLGNETYWYGDTFTPYNGAWNFYFDHGNQGASNNLAEHEFFAWAVMDGDVEELAHQSVSNTRTVYFVIAGLLAMFSLRPLRNGMNSHRTDMPLTNN